MKKLIVTLLLFILLIPSIANAEKRFNSNYVSLTAEQLYQIVQEIIDGKWENEPIRYKWLEMMHLDSNYIQSVVNRVVKESGNENTFISNDFVPEINVYNYGDYGRFVIESIGVNVALYDYDTVGGVCDGWDIAVKYWSNGYCMIADHVTEQFTRLKTMNIGDYAYIIHSDGSKEEYSVCYIDVGYSDGYDFHYYDGTYIDNTVSADLIAYTCHPHWNNVIYIFFERM